MLRPTPNKTQYKRENKKEVKTIGIEMGSP